MTPSRRGILRTPFLRNIFFISVLITLFFPVLDRWVVYPMFSGYLVANTEDEAIRMARHLALELDGGLAGKTAATVPPQFVTETETVMPTLGLWKLKLFSGNGETIFSTDPADVGKVNTNDYFLNIVARGGVYTKVVAKEQKTLEGQTTTTDVVETYVPIMTGGRFDGAFEIYYDITGRLDRLEGILFTASLVAGGGGGLLLLVLVWTLAEAARTVAARDRAERRYRTLVEASPDGTVVCEREGMSFANPATLAMLGADSADAVCGRRLIDFVVPEDRERVVEAIEAVVVGRSPEGTVHGCCLQTLDGRVLEVEMSVRAVELQDGPAAEVIVHDLTARREAERYQRLAATVFETSTEAMMAIGRDNVVEMVNPAFTRITGFPPHEVVGQAPVALHPDREPDRLFAEIADALQRDGVWRGELWNRRKTGEAFAQRMTISAIKEERGGISRFVCVFSDITEEKLESERVRHRADHDTLTGLPNRAVLENQLAQAVGNQRRHRDGVAVLFVDLDGFKPVNDTYGHGAGDLALREVSERLRQVVRETDTVARLGGDEFVIMLRNIDERDAVERIAVKILESFAAPFDVGEARVRMGCSMGIARYPDDGIDSRTLLQNADRAMYRAKRDGKGVFRFYDPAVDLAA